MLQTLNKRSHGPRSAPRLLLSCLKPGSHTITLVLVCAATMLTVACGGSDVTRSALRPVDTTAMQHAVETLAKEMLVPGTVVVLRTPDGEFITTYGTTTHGGTVPPAPTTIYESVRTPRHGLVQSSCSRSRKAGSDWTTQ